MRGEVREVCIVAEMGEGEEEGFIGGGVSCA